MTEHLIETCPDDMATLKQRLDDLAAGGATIISVMWQAQRVETDQQSAAYDARGSFVIVASLPAADILRSRNAAQESGVIEVLPVA